MQRATTNIEGDARFLRTLVWASMAATLLLLLAGCQSAPGVVDRATVSANLTERIGHSVPCCVEPSQITLPPGAAFEDGITEDEAVAIALWNNAAFQELLADLGIARGDLIQAGLLPNPEFVYYVPMSDKPYKYLLDFPLEALWLRPIRLKTAANEADRTTQRLTQGGLDLMRDVRQAYADVVLAIERAQIARDAEKLRGRIVELAEKRLQAGDISPQEAATARIDALRTGQEAARLAYDVPILEERLRNLMGLGPLRAPLPLDATPPPACRTVDVDCLTGEALGSRPDALAATSAVGAAEARVKFARLGWVRLLGIADATSGKESHVLGPAARVTVPLFHHNQGGITRAEAELEKAVSNQKTVANQIILDVRRAYLQYQQSCAELEVLRAQIRPEVEGAIRRAEAAYREGDVSIFIVLETNRQLLDSNLREAQLRGDLRRYWAELERSVGRRLLPIPAEPIQGQPPATLPAPQAGLLPMTNGNMAAFQTWRSQ